MKNISLGHSSELMETCSEADRDCQSGEKSSDVPGPSGIVPVKRSSRRSQGQVTTTACPVCGVLVKLADIEDHFELELTKLDELMTTRASKRTITARLATFREKQEREGIIQEVRRNRSRRITKRTLPPNKRQRLPGEVVCPVCSEQLNHLSEEDRLIHANSCLNIDQQQGPSTSAAEIDIEGGSSDDGLEEYEWAGQSRVRAVSIANIVPRNNSHGREEDIGELDVDGDEDQLFGVPQFSESDLISTTNADQSQKVRQIMVRAAASETRKSSDNHSKWVSIPDAEEAKDEVEDVNVSGPSHVVIASLRKRIQELESGNKSTRCLVCLEAYTDPLVSVACWHVYCQDCWLETLSCKKLCPQCSTITNPGDLRKIYL